MIFAANATTNRYVQGMTGPRVGRPFPVNLGLLPRCLKAKSSRKVIISMESEKRISP